MARFLPLTRRNVLKVAWGCSYLSAFDRLSAAELITNADAQPVLAQTRRLLESLELLGSTLSSKDISSIAAVLANPSSSDPIAEIQRVLDLYVLLNVRINPESRVSVTKGEAAPGLVQNGWRVFLVKVNNEAGVTAKLGCTSPQSLADSGQAPNSQVTSTGVVPAGSSRPVHSISAADVMDRWLEVEMFDKPPLTPALSGLPIEYRVIQLYSRDSGKREAQISFDVGAGSRDIGFRNSAAVLFSCRPAYSVRLRVRDTDGAPATASFTITDQQGRIYPSCAKRLAPDFPFQKQIYRADGNSVHLASGVYKVAFDRGPEYIPKSQELTVSPLSSVGADFRLQRWIDPTEFGWYPGDHHVHAAGCSHYNSPGEGVRPTDMAPQVRGEGLSFADVLTWGPCWYHQKEFFRGHVDPVSDSGSILRYDVEISGFPSSYWGHLVLLQLAKQDYPGAEKIEDWPTWNLPILRWAKSQGAVTGFAHTGHGLEVSSDELPNLLIPEFSDNGANEFLIDVTHGLVDFLSAADTPAPAELNIWYHVLNCGFKIPIAGETDFPCLFEKVGIGRSYVYLATPPAGDAGYREWIAGLSVGHSYVSDGRSHILELKVGETKLKTSHHEIKLDSSSSIKVAVEVAAYLPQKLAEETRAIKTRPLNEAPYWHLERSRIGNSRRVPVELVVNGKSVARKEIEADGGIKSVGFETVVERSSWVAVRIFPTCHSNPIYISVGGKPIRASRESAAWCIKCIQAAWLRLGNRIAARDKLEAEGATKEAIATFRRILSETSSA